MIIRESEPLNTPYSVARFYELPPSAKFTFYILKLKGILTIPQLLSETRLPDRTLDFALNLLLQNDFIVKSKMRITGLGKKKRNHYQITKKGMEEEGR